MKRELWENNNPKKKEVFFFLHDCLLLYKLFKSKTRSLFWIQCGDMTRFTQYLTSLSRAIIFGASEFIPRGSSWNAVMIEKFHSTSLSYKSLKFSNTVLNWKNTNTYPDYRGIWSLTTRDKSKKANYN